MIRAPMRRSSKARNSDQAAFSFEEVSLPTRDVSELHEASATTTAPPWASTPEYVPVYTVFLRRSDVLSVRERPIIRSPQDAAAVVREYLASTNREHFVILLLDTKNAVIGINTVSVGILNSAPIHPREVYKPAILANAANIILAHNHPSGDPTPSAEDRHVTEKLVQAGEILGITVLDHVIVGDGGRYASLKDRGMM